ICAYYVRLGNRAVNIAVSIVLSALVAIPFNIGVQYVAFDGQSCWFLAIFILGFSSIMGAVNYLATIIKLRCPGMTMFRMPLPVMGFVSDIISVFARKPIFGYRPMVYALSGIAFLGFIVWAHHMFQSGMNPTLGTTFAISTMFIAVPSAIKTFNWLGTLWGGNIRFTAAMLFALAFVAQFVVGGLSGIFMASTAVDVHIHDTYFIVAHIHYVLFGSTVFGIFGALYFWYPKMFGRMMSERLGKVHFWLTF